MGLKRNPNLMLKKIFIKTFGCQMNEYDSNRIFDIVKKIGFEKTDKYEDANCYLLNTCHIRDKAKEKVYHEYGRCLKDNNLHLHICLFFQNLFFLLYEIYDLNRIHSSGTQKF